MSYDFVYPIIYKYFDSYDQIRLSSICKSSFNTYIIVRDKTRENYIKKQRKMLIDFYRKYDSRIQYSRIDKKPFVFFSNKIDLLTDDDLDEVDSNILKIYRTS